MMQKPKDCRNCILDGVSIGFSITDGKCSNRVLFIGESLGSMEVKDAMPFRPYAEAGSALHTALRILQYRREDFGYWNMIGCQPPFNNLENTAYEYDAIDHCKVHFNKVLAKFQPKVIVALGNVPLKHLWKRDPRIDEVIAALPETTKEEKKDKKKYLKNFLIGSMRGYTLPSIYGIPMIPSLHPSYITRNFRVHLGVLMQDIYKALWIAKNGIPQFVTDYKEKPKIEEIKWFLEECRRQPKLPISYDIETPMTLLEIDESETEFENQQVRDIDSIQFSIQEGTGIYVDWNEDNLDLIRAILALPNPKVGWNSNKFDETNIEYHLGKGAIAGDKFDVMWMWKWKNQDFVKLGRALQFATNFYSMDFPAWKHLSKIEPRRYACLDPDAALRNFNGLKTEFNSPQLRAKSVWTTLFVKESKTLWEGYIDDVVNLRPITEDMSKRGFPIDLKEREKFREKIELEREKVLAELQEMYPTNLRRLDPLEGYKFVPKEVIEIEKLFYQASLYDNSGPYYILDSNETLEFRLAQYIEEHTRRSGTTGLVLKEFQINGGKEKRWVRMEEFKPGSSQQVLNYIKFKGYKVPKVRDKKRRERETSAKDQLQPLWEETGDDLLYKSIYLRELDHMLDTYVGTGEKEGWRVGSDNCVHAAFTNIPATGQLSTIRPNIQNAPARGTKYSSKGYKELAEQFRKIVAARPGKTLVSADWSAFHINTMAFEAEDAEYLRLAPIDPHSYLNAYILRDPLPRRLAKLKLKKPDSMEHSDWIARIEKHEEAIGRIKFVDQWMSWPDEKLIPELLWFKKNYKMERDSQAKPALLGLGFGMGVNRFFKENRHTFKSKAEPERILGIMHKRFPKIFVEYHEKVMDLADRQTYLISRYGYIRRFFDVYDWRQIPGPKSPKYGEKVIRNMRGEWWSRKFGNNAKEAIAYLPANNAFGKKKEAMRDFWEHPNGNLCKAYGLINEIHDDLMWEIEDGLLNEALPIIKEVMERPARYLKNDLAPNGLVTKVELKIGRNWGQMEEVRL